MQQKYIPSEHRTETKYIRQVSLDVRQPKSLLKVLNSLLEKYLKIRVVKSNAGLRKEDKFRLIDAHLNKVKNEKLASLLVSYYRNLGFVLTAQDLEQQITKFDEVFWNRPFSSLSNGMGYNNALITYLLIHLSQPKLIAESGVWRGFTSYILHTASSMTCKLKCFDINFSPLEWKSDRADYYEHDISKEKHIVTTDELSVFLFDDHVAHYDRLLLAAEANANFIIVDDDVSAITVHSDGVPAIPTAAMIYEYHDIPKRFKWQSNKKIMEADINNIDISTIKELYLYSPFPDLKFITGYDNSSFSSVLKRK